MEIQKLNNNLYLCIRLCEVHGSSLIFFNISIFFSFLFHASLDIYVENTCIHGLHNISCCIFDNSHFTAGRHTPYKLYRAIIYERDHHRCIDWDGHKEATKQRRKVNYYIKRDMWFTSLCPWWLCIILIFFVNTCCIFFWICDSWIDWSRLK